MKIPPHLAQELLTQNFQNICAKLTAGGTLTTAEAAMMEKVAADSRAATATPSASPTLHLTPAPSPALGDGSVSQHQLDAWSELYGTKTRQLRRWIARGKEKNDPCPLDNPALMPGWIDRNVEKIRAKLRECVASVSESHKKPTAPATAPPDQPSSAPVSSESAFDLASVEGIEGEQVAFYRQLFAATKMELEKAYREGVDSRISVLHKRLESTGEALIKHEKAAMEKAKRAGRLITEEQFAADWTAVIELFKQMRTHRVKAILAELGNLEPELREKISQTITNVTTREDEVFSRLGKIQSTDDIFLTLAA